MPQLSPDMIIHERYQLQRPLGRGGFSIVWLALDLKDANKPIALKVSLPDKDPAGEQPKRMERQHAATLNLSHPHLLLSRDYFMVENAGCLVFDYMAKGTLHQKVKQHGPLEEAEIAVLMSQIGDAIQYLHNHSLVHFDIKPENILINAEGAYFLSDFDTTSQLENSMVRVSRIYADTPQYRSPEHLRGAAELSEKVDIFAFGTTLFEMCEGIMENEYAIGVMLLSGSEKPNIDTKKYSIRLENIVHACWNHNPSDRPMADALVSYAAHRMAKNFWPNIVEYNASDKALPDSPASKGSETARITVGRPTVATPVQEDVPVQRRETISPYTKPAAKTIETVSDQPAPFKPETPKQSPLMEQSEKKDRNYARIGILSLLGIAVLALGYYYVKAFMQNRKFNEYMQVAIEQSNQNNLKEAYAAVKEAQKIKPDDSTQNRVRMDMLQQELRRHRDNLSQVRTYLASKDESLFAIACQLLQEDKNNASILKGDDSTAHYLALIPNCGEKETISSSTTITTPPAADPSVPTQGQSPSNTTEITRPEEKKSVVSNDKTGTNKVVTTPVVTKPTETKPVTPPPTQPIEYPAEIKAREMASDNLDWEDAKKANTKAAYRTYLAQHSKGIHAKEATQEINKPEPIPVPVPVPPVNTNVVFKNVKITGLLISEYSIPKRKTNEEGGSIQLRPAVPMELAEIILFGDSPGKVNITLEDGSGKVLGKMRGSVSSDTRSQFQLADLGVRLEPGKSYTLRVTPIRDANTGKKPGLYNMRDNAPSFNPDPNLKIDYQGNYIFFEIKYKY